MQNIAFFLIRSAHRSSVGPLGPHPAEVQTKKPLFRVAYRNSGIRTHDLLLPKQALYQAELYSGDDPILEKFLFVRKGKSQNNFIFVFCRAE